MGNGGEGGKGFLQEGVGGRAWENNADTGFDGSGGPYGARIDAGRGGGYSGEGCGENVMSPVEAGGGGSDNTGRNQQNECCYNIAGRGQVNITLI